jgi:hypothetical protein
VTELGVAGGEVDAALGDSVHPSVSTTRESAVATRRIHRHYVARSNPEHVFIRAPDRPSGSQDTAPAEIDSPPQKAIVTACILQERFSSYVSVSAEQKLIPTRSLACQLAAGVFCWYEDLRAQA